MEEYKHHYKILIATILTAPLLMAGYSYMTFETSVAKKELAVKMDSQVAGAEDRKFIDDVTKDVPLMPNSEITSMSKSNGDLTLTIKSENSEKEITSFYDDFFFKNNWQQLEKNRYQKGFKIVDLEISDDIIKIRITK